MFYLNYVGCKVQDAWCYINSWTSFYLNSVVGEAMLAIVLADALLEKLGGDFMEEVKERFKRYMEHVKAF